MHQVWGGPTSPQCRGEMPGFYSVAGCLLSLSRHGWRHPESRTILGCRGTRVLPEPREATGPLGLPDRWPRLEHQISC